MPDWQRKTNRGSPYHQLLWLQNCDLINNFKYMRSFYLTVAVVFIDQFSKILIKKSLNLYESVNVLGSFLRFSFTENNGMGFGIDIGSYQFPLFIITLLITLYLIYFQYTQRDLSFYENLPMNLILGGAIGNLIDRTLMCIPNSGYGGVVDFVDIGFGYYRWFTFNVADIAITFGIVLYLLLPLLKNKGTV